MEVNLTFAEADFVDMRTFEKAVKRQLGDNVYVGTDSMCLYFAYPKALKDMIRPHPPKVQLEFKLESSLPDKKV